MKRLTTLFSLLLLAVMSVWADQVVLSSPSEQLSTYSDANGIITITDPSEKGGIQQGSGTIAYEGGSAKPMKLSSSRLFNLTYSNDVTVNKVTLYATSNKTDETEYTIGTSGDDKTSLGVLPKKGQTPLVVDITNTTSLCASVQFLAVIVVDYSVSTPSLKVSPETLSFSLSPISKSKSETFTLAARNLTDGTYNLTVPSVDGLSVAPTSFTVASGSCDQEFTVTYQTEAEVAKAEAVISATVDELTANVTVSYKSRATVYTQSTVSAEAAWDWSKLTETVELTTETTPTKSEEFLLADLDDRINFTEAFGDAKAIKMENMQFPTRGGYAQGSTIKFTTSVAGTVAVDFSNTGKDRPYRYLTVNGVATEFKSNTSGKVSATNIEVPAGEVVISCIIDPDAATNFEGYDESKHGVAGAATMVRYYKVAFTPKAPEYSIAGSPAALFGAEWDATNTTTNMTLNGEGLYEWSAEDVTLSKGNVEFKVVVDHAWAEAYPKSNYQLAISEDAKYDVTITFNADTKAVNATATKKSSVEITHTYTVAGEPEALFGTTWDTTNTSNDMTVNGEGLYEWSKSDVTLNAGTVKFKVVMDHSWSNAWPEKDYALAIDKTGKYDVTITFNADSEEVGAVATYKGEADLNTYTATFTTNAGWEKVYAYAWTGETKYLGDWPGTEITATEGVYSLSFKAADAPAYIIFNNGTGGEGNQTGDLAFENGKEYSFITVVDPVNADFTADEAVASKICTYAKDAKEGQVANMQAVTGWTIVENGDGRAAGTFSYGSDATLGGDTEKAPAAGPDGEAEGKALGIVAVWKATSKYTQEVTLPAGQYMLEAVVYNAAGTGALSQNLIGVGDSCLTTTKYPVGQWMKDQVTFTTEKDSTLTFSIGVNSGNVGNAAAPHLFIDQIKLYAGAEDIAAAKEAAVTWNAAAAFAKVKQDALAELQALPIGDALFYYPESAVNTAIEAVNNATTEEAVNEAIATVKAAQNKPVADKVYQITNNTANGLMLSIGNDKVTLEESADVYLTEVEGGWAISNTAEAREYIFKTTNNNWTLSDTTKIEDAYIVNFNVVEGGYSIQGAKGLIGTDATTAGSSLFANKAIANNGVWNIAEKPVVISSMYILGDFTGGWEFADTQKMTQSQDNPAIWTLTVNNFEVAYEEGQTSRTYEYKAAANGNWNDYKLPDDGNQNWVFGEDRDYKAGKYDLVFTADTQNHILTLAVNAVATGINDIKTAMKNGNVYNLNGQKVNKTQKGLYIVNGKKVVIK